MKKELIDYFTNALLKVTRIQQLSGTQEEMPDSSTSLHHPVMPLFGVLVAEIIEQYKRQRGQALTVMLEGEAVSLKEHNAKLYITWGEEEKPLADMTLATLTARLQIDRWHRANSYGLSADERQHLLRNANFSTADLRNVDLKLADLRKTDFSNADLMGASLGNANLTETKFVYADLTHACLIKANLHKADLYGATLNKAVFHNACLTDADLTNASLKRADFTNADLTNADLTNADLTDADFTSANLSEANFTAADLTQADLTNASLRRANFTNADLTNADLINANLTEANLTGADFSAANLTEATLTNATLTDVLFMGADLRRASLSSNPVIRSDFRSADLTGADLSDSKVILRLPTVWNDARLDGYLNHTANGRSLITAINSIDMRFTGLKIDMMRQLISGLDRQPGINLHSFLHSLLDCLRPHYLADTMLAPFLEQRVILPVAVVADRVPWRVAITNVNACQSLLAWVQEKSDVVKYGQTAFADFVLQHNGFFMQLIYQGRQHEEIREQAEALYEDYLKLDRIKPYRSDRYGVFGDFSGQVDWENKTARNYIFTAGLGDEQQTLIVSEDQLDGMLDATRPKPSGFWGELLFYKNGVQIKNLENHIEGLFNNEFKLFSASYISSLLMAQSGKLWNLFAWDRVTEKNYHNLFIRAVTYGRSQTKLVELGEQEALQRILGDTFILSEEGSVEPRLNENHCHALLKTLRLTQAKSSDQAKGLMSVAQLFVRLSSSQIFGTEDNSPYVLRSYAAALLARANQLDPSAFSASEVAGDKTRYQDWQDRLLGRNNTFTCTDILYEMMNAYSQVHYSQILNRVNALIQANPSDSLAGYPDVSGSPPINNRDAVSWSLPPSALMASARRPAKSTKTQYQRQLIVQLENDDAVRHAAVRLAGKHPDRSVLVQMDVQGDFLAWKTNNNGTWQRLSDSELKEFFQDTDQVRCQYVAHGRSLEGETGTGNNSTLGGQTSKILAKNSKILFKAMDRAPNYISLVGCALTDGENPDSYAYQLATLLKAQGIQADIGARSMAVRVDEQGRKLTQDVKGQWHYKKSEDKVVWQWNTTGELIIRRSLEPETERAALLLETLWQGERLPGQLNTRERQLCYDFFALQNQDQLDSLLREYTIQSDDAAQLRAAVMTLGQEGLLQKKRLVSLEELTTWENVTQALSSDALSLPAFPKSESLLPSLFKTSQKLFKTSQKLFSNNAENSLSRITGIAGHLTQGLGSVSSLLSILSRKAAMAVAGLTNEERSVMQHEIDVSTAELTVGLVGSGMELAVHPLYRWLFAQQPQMTKLIEHGLHGVLRQLQGGFATLPKQTLSFLRFAAAGQINTLLRVTGMGVQALGPLFAATGVGFGLYDFSQAITALQTETDPQKRQDLQVRAAFAMTGALTGMGTAVVPAVVAAVAWLCGATAVAAGAMTALNVLGPVGAAIGVLMLAGGWIYGGVRRVEEVGKAITLSGWDKFRTGWSSLSGTLPPDVKIRYAAAALAEQLARSLEEGSHEFLKKHTQYDAFYYSHQAIQPGHVIVPSNFGEGVLQEFVSMWTLGMVNPAKTTDPTVIQADDTIEGDQQPVGLHDGGTYDRAVALRSRVEKQAIAMWPVSYSSENSSRSEIVHSASIPLRSREFGPEFGPEKRNIIQIRPDNKGTLRAYLFPGRRNGIIIAGDFNGDGQDDFLTPVHMRLFHRVSVAVQDAKWMLSGDVNGDGCTDIILISEDNRVRLLQGRSEQQQPFDAAITLPDTKGLAAMLRTVFSSPSCRYVRLFLHDMNRDGCADLVAIDDSMQTQVALADGSGAFSAPVSTFALPVLSGHSLEGASIIGIEAKTQRLMVITPTPFSDNRNQLELHRFIRDRQAYVHLGKGKDTFRASGSATESAYLFDCEDGDKNYTGGQQNDIFLLRESAANARSSLDGSAGENTLILQGYGGSDIDLKKEHDAINRTTLRNISHVHGESDFFGTRISGNEHSNHFTDRGKNSVFRGYDGNDVLTLADGLAVGGRESDHYIIVKPGFEGIVRDGFDGRDINIELREEEGANVPGDGAINSVELQDYVAADIELITLTDGRITLLLNNGDGRSTRLKVSGRAAEYLFVTRDGVQFTLPALTASEERRDYDTHNRLAVTYRPEQDKTREGPQKKITLSRLQERDEITVSRQDGKYAHTHQLPLFMQLQLHDTAFDDVRQGNHEEEWLESHQGSDFLQGHGGSDHYVIFAEKAVHRKVWINNCDDGAVPAEDSLHLPWSVADTALHWQDQDLVLTDSTAEAASVEIHLKHFALSAQYRHLNVQDANDRRGALIYKESDSAVTGAAWLVNEKMLKPGTENNPAPETLYAGTTPITLGTAEEVKPQRLFSMSAQGAVLRGGKGGDFLMATAGKNLFYAGQGNDEMAGGFDDDDYYYRKGDDDDIITDSGGNDKLVLQYIQKRQLHFSQKSGSLIIAFDNSEENSADKLTIKNQFTGAKQQAIERIELDNGSYLLLAEAIAAFSTGTQSSESVSLQQHLELAWRAPTLGTGSGLTHEIEI